MCMVSWELSWSLKGQGARGVGGFIVGVTEA